MHAIASYERGLKLSSAGRHLEAIACYEEALAGAPSDPRILFALGNTARHLDLPGPAESFYRQVLALEPLRLEALVNLANLLRGQGQFQAAADLLTPALTALDGSPELFLTLGSVWREAGDEAQAMHFYRAALARQPHYPPALANLADLLAATDPDQARTLYGQAIKADPGNAQARLNRAILNLLTGQLKDGWRDYEARTAIPGKVPATEQRFAAWTGGPLKNTRLLVRAEQGVGDQILFASLFGELAARAAKESGSLVLECEPRLAPLFARSFPGATVKGAVLKAAPGGVTADYGWLKSEGGANAAVPMGSLPRYLRKTPDSFPRPHAYLVPALAEQVRWHGVFAALGPAPLIGLCWRSGKSGGHRSAQYAPLAAWADFIRGLPGSLVCAQYDATAAEIAELENLSGRRIFTPPGLDQKQELDRACAMLSALDVLVSAPTAVSWLGAAAGVTTLKILYDTSWTALGETVEPFAPACQLMQPKAAGDWRDGFAQAAAAIARL